LETNTIPPETPLNHWGLSIGLTNLRTKLFCKAKAEPKFRFYSLFGHVTRKDTLLGAWTRVKSNQGSPGIDGISFKDIENQEGGVDNFLENLLRDLIKIKLPTTEALIYNSIHHETCAT